jgi:hypothetical protein
MRDGLAAHQIIPNFPTIKSLQSVIAAGLAFELMALGFD